MPLFQLGTFTKFIQKERQTVFARQGNLRWGPGGNEVLNCGVVIVSYVEVANSVGRLTNSLSDIAPAFILYESTSTNVSHAFAIINTKWKKNPVSDGLWFILYFIAWEL